MTIGVYCDYTIMRIQKKNLKQTYSISSRSDSWIILTKFVDGCLKKKIIIIIVQNASNGRINLNLKINFKRINFNNFPPLSKI